MPLETSSAANSAGRTAGLRAPEPSSEERALLAAVLAKDRKAAAEFVSRYADAIYGYVSRRLAPRADIVEDVVQDVFLVALQKLATFEGQSSVVGWLLGIARHKVEDFYRAQLREPDPLPDDGDMPSAGSTVTPGLEEQIDAARAEEKTRRTSSCVGVFTLSNRTDDRAASRSVGYLQASGGSGLGGDDLIRDASKIRS